MKKFNTKKTGFTLIELIIVIAVIAILATIALFSFNRVQRQARDARRKADMKSIQTALEAYNADNGTYPTSLGCLTGGTTAGCTVRYLGNVPNMPQGAVSAITGNAATNTTTPYAYQGAANAFALCAALELPAVNGLWVISSSRAGGQEMADAACTTANFAN